MNSIPQRVAIIKFFNHFMWRQVLFVCFRRGKLHNFCGRRGLQKAAEAAQIIMRKKGELLGETERQDLKGHNSVGGRRK
jgi:hypothetical protein